MNSYSPGTGMVRLRTIDAARGFAALWVLVFHALVFIELPIRGGLLAPNRDNYADIPGTSFIAREQLSRPERYVRELLHPLFVGALGVPMFFVISGFCIHLPVARAAARGGDWMLDYGKYAKRRFWRLYPTHLAAILGSIALITVTHQVLLAAGHGPIKPLPTGALVAHFAMLQAQLPNTAAYLFYYNANLWSLETEVQLYAAYLVLLKLSRVYGWKRLLLIFAVLDVAYCFLQGHYISDPGWNWALKTLFVGHLYTWCLGAFLVDELFRKRRSNVYSSLAGYGSLIVFCSLLLPGSSLEGAREMLFATAFAVLLWWAVWRENVREPSSRLVHCLSYVGVRSYSLYLWQAPVIRTVVILFLVYLPWMRTSYATALGVSLIAGLAAYVVSLLAFAFFEKHFLSNRTGSFVSPAAAPADLPVATPSTTA